LRFANKEIDFVLAKLNLHLRVVVKSRVFS
jgi:hypothetical protein